MKEETSIDIEKRFVAKENEVLTANGSLNLAMVSPLDYHIWHIRGHLSHIWNLKVFLHTIKHIPFLFRKKNRTENLDPIYEYLMNKYNK